MAMMQTQEELQKARDTVKQAQAKNKHYLRVARASGTEWHIVSLLCSLYDFEYVPVCKNANFDLATGKFIINYLSVGNLSIMPRVMSNIFFIFVSANIQILSISEKPNLC